MKMAKKRKQRPALEDLLASCSHALFPASLGEQPVTIDSRGSDGDTPLHVLLRRRDAASSLTLIEAGADINASGDMSETPLLLAVQNGDEQVVRALLDRGADPDAKSEWGKSARAAAKNASREIQQMIERYRQ